MAQLPAPEWRDEDILSDSYFDAFYKAHVVSRRGPGGVEDDIAAIEAEIQKVRGYQSHCRTYRWDNALNSCGSSECSDDISGDESDPFSGDSSPTSVFKVYDSSSRVQSPHALPRGPDIFSWAVLQQVSHDHSYLAPPPDDGHTPLDHNSLNMQNINWEVLSAAKRAQAVLKIASILQHRPAEPLPPSISSLDLLPHSLAICIRKTNSLGVNSIKREGGGRGAGGGTKVKPHAVATVTCQKIDIKEIKAKQRVAEVSHNSSAVGVFGPSPRNSSRKRTRQSPYEKPAKHPRHEASRTRTNSTGSDSSEDPIVID